jgi:hypothetical protein
VHSGASEAQNVDALFFTSEAQNVDALFFMFGWAQSGLHRKHAGTCYAQLVFLHPIGSAGLVVHYGASRA